MPAPLYSATTERLYNRLPEFLRAVDGRNDWLMKRFVSAIADRQGGVDVLISRIDYITLPDGGKPGDTSDLVDAQTADARWLGWIGQLFGVRLYPGMSEAEQRDAVRFASSGFKGGTKAGIAAAAKSALTGTRYARVYDHSQSAVGDGGQWDVLVMTRGTETPDVDAVLRTVILKRAKPAGVVLHHRAYSTSWDILEAAYPTSDHWDATRSWNVIEETGLNPRVKRPYGTGRYGEGTYG